MIVGVILHVPSFFETTDGCGICIFERIVASSGSLLQLRFSTLKDMLKIWISITLKIRERNCANPLF